MHRRAWEEHDEKVKDKADVKNLTTATEVAIQINRIVALAGAQAGKSRRYYNDHHPKTTAIIPTGYAGKHENAIRFVNYLAQFCVSDQNQVIAIGINMKCKVFQIVVADSGEVTFKIVQFLERLVQLLKAASQKLSARPSAARDAPPKDLSDLVEKAFMEQLFDVIMNHHHVKFKSQIDKRMDEVCKAVEANEARVQCENGHDIAEAFRDALQDPNARSSLKQIVQHASDLSEALYGYEILPVESRVKYRKYLQFLLYEITANVDELHKI